MKFRYNIKDFEIDIESCDNNRKISYYGLEDDFNIYYEELDENGQCLFIEIIQQTYVKKLIKEIFREV